VNCRFGRMDLKLTKWWRSTTGSHRRRQSTWVMIKHCICKTESRCTLMNTWLELAESVRSQNLEEEQLWHLVRCMYLQVIRGSYLSAFHFYLLLSKLPILTFIFELYLHATMLDKKWISRREDPRATSNQKLGWCRSTYSQVAQDYNSHRSRSLCVVVFLLMLLCSCLSFLQSW